MTCPGARNAVTPSFPLRARSWLALAVALTAALASSLAQAQTSADTPCAEVWQVAPTPVVADLLGLAASPDGTWVAVGRGGTVLTSANGTTWQRHDVGVEADLHAVAWGGGRFVVVGDGGATLTSPNGEAWTRPETGSAVNLTGVAESGQRFVAVGSSGSAAGYLAGSILTSEDGERWANRPAGELLPLLSVTFDGVRFVAVGYLGAVATSIDGLSWTVGSAAGTLQACWFMLRPSYLFAVAGSAPRLVAVGLVVGDQYPGLGVALTSTDGQVWQCRLTELPPDYFRFHGVCWDGRRFIAGGLGGKLGESDDGITWRPLPSPASRNLLAVAAGWAGVVAVGEGGTVVVGGCPAPHPIRRRLVRSP